MSCDTLQALLKNPECLTKTISQLSGEEADDDWKKTNVGVIGSDQDKAVRKNAAQKEEAWATAGQKAGIEIWRIMNWSVKPVDPETYGKFYQGDSYICLKTTEKLSHDIHFLIGKESTADEYGTATYKTVELDDYFDGEPTEHREHQTEGISDAFNAMFPNIEFLEGGAESAFKHVIADHDNVLYQIREHKGDLKIMPVPLSTSSLNPSDSFILDGKKIVFVYHGPESNGIEQTTAEKVAAEIKKKREDTEVTGGLNGNIHRARLSQTSVSGAGLLDDAFWKALEGDKPEWYVEIVHKQEEVIEAKRKSTLRVDKSDAIYPLETLVLKSENGLPLDVETGQKEMHLSDADFLKLFGVTKTEFGALPKWKQASQKKALDLF